MAEAGEQCLDGTTVPVGGVLTFYGNNFQDPVTGEQIQNPRMTTHSIFDQHLHQRGLPLIFAYNCFNIDRAADILLRRAVSYSASLLTYFFRGSVGARDDVDSQNAGQRAFRVVNQSMDEEASGTFGLYVELENGLRTRLASWDLTLGPGEASAPLAVSRLPDTTPSSTRCSIVFRGYLGSELDAVAGGPAPCPLELAPPPPTPWLVYFCATFDSQYNYFYATQDPPRYPEGDAVARFSLAIDGASFDCSYQRSVRTVAPPSNARLDHPTTLGS